MESFHRRRSPARVISPSNITTTTDRSPAEKLKLRRDAQKGNLQTTKQKITKSETYSNSYVNEVAQPLSDRERSNSKQPSVTLMKSLLADEMSKGTESRKRPQSIIAKLMGLDGLPSPRSSTKQSGRSSTGIPEKVPPGGGSSRSSRPCNNLSCNSVAKNQQHFKDVYEVRDNLKGRSDSRTAHTPARPNRRHAEDEAFVRPTFMDVKCILTDENLQSSKEFDDALEVLNSNNRLFLKFLQEPDLLFAKHPHDSCQSHCEHIRNLRSSNILDYNINAIGSQVGREASRKIDISLSHDLQDCLHGHRCSRDFQDSDKSLIFPAKFKEENAEPTQIVLLKPNVARMQKSAKSVPVSSSFGHEPRKHIGGGPLEDGLRRKKNLPNDLGFSAHKFRESRELAKEITQKMRRTLGEGSLYFSSSGHRGYSADESSHDMSENDSSYDSDVIVNIQTPQTPRRRSIQSTPLPSHCAESSVNREAKKRLSERWKMTQRREGKRVANYGSTLGEMLAIQDIDVRPTNVDASMGPDRFSTRFGSSDSLEEWDEPLGISSKDGCKEGYIVTLPRSRSLPRLHDQTGRHDVQSIHNLNKEGSRHGKKKIIRKDMSGNDGSSYSGRLRQSDQKSQSSVQISPVTMDRTEDCHSDAHGKSACSREDGDSFELKTVILETPTCQPDTSLNSVATVEAEHAIISETLNSGYNVVETASFSISGQAKDDSSCSGNSTSRETSIKCQRYGSACLMSPVVQPESGVCSKEVDQPSPVSVLELEAPFLEDISSSSECFERVSADLQGLRMQLQLLRLESKAYSEDDEAMRISSDEDGRGEEYPLGFNLPKPFLVEFDEYWEASYLGDVLASLCIDEITPESFTASWYSPDCPLGPMVFDKLEKTYAKETYCSRPERRLLFDRINVGILEISRKFMDPHPWVKSGLCRVVRRRWKKYELGAELWKALESGEVEDGSGYGIDVAVTDEIDWVDLRKHIDGIGAEIENMILEELSDEVFGNYRKLCM